VSDVELSLTHFPDGSNMHGNVTIPNASVMTLTIGDMFQELFVDGKKIGNTTIKGVTLRPGDNQYPVTSITEQTAIIPLIGPGKKYPDGNLLIEARTVSITYNGQLLPYFTEAMKASPVYFNMNIADPLRKLGLGGLLGDPPKPLSSSSASPSPSPSSSPASTMNVE